MSNCTPQAKFVATPLHKATSEQRPPVNNGHKFRVQRVVVVHRFDCILMFLIQKIIFILFRSKNDWIWSSAQLELSQRRRRSSGSKWSPGNHALIQVRCHMLFLHAFYFILTDETACSKRWKLKQFVTIDQEWNNLNYFFLEEAIKKEKSVLRGFKTHKHHFW